MRGSGGAPIFVILRSKWGDEEHRGILSAGQQGRQALAARACVQLADMAGASAARVLKALGFVVVLGLALLLNFSWLDLNSYHNLPLHYYHHYNNSNNNNTSLIAPNTTTSNTMAAKSATDTFLELVKNRRTHYALSKDLPITPARIQEIVKESTLHTPSSFNAQSNRLLVLFGAEHDKLWDFAAEILKAIVPEARWEDTATRLNLFKGAAGTILFFEDQDTINRQQEKLAIYADKFPIWADQSAAIQQYILWTALEAEGLGANLQHYNPLLDQKVAETWDVPASWKLNAQLVFGGKAGEAGDKDFLSVKDRVKVFGV